EINNPLAYVMINLEMILEHLKSEGTTVPLGQSSMRELAVQALHGSERVRVIVNDLKNLSRGGDDCPVCPVDLIALLEWSITVTDHQVRHRARLVRDFRSVPLVTSNEVR